LLDVPSTPTDAPLRRNARSSPIQRQMNTKQASCQSKPDAKSLLCNQM
jgi:hypothetical protein